MNIDQWRDKLDGREYRQEITDQEILELSKDGMVIVYGYSDDNTILSGFINEFISTWDGGTISIDTELKEVLEECECKCNHYKVAYERSVDINVLWCKDDEYSWTYETKIKSREFDILEDGEKYCKAIIFNVHDLYA